MLSLRLPVRDGAFPGAGLQALNAVAGRAAAVVLLLVCFYYASSLFWRVFYPEGFRLVVPAVSGSAVTKVADARGRWDWFADTATVKSKAAPRSRLKANLIGVIAQGAETGKGLALIKYKGKEEIYRVGDEVAPAIVLKEVAGTYVTLQRDDQTETLEIEKAAGLFGGDKKQVRKNAARSTAGAGKSSNLPAGKLPGAPPPVAAAKQFKNLLRKEPLQLLNLFSFEQVRNGNQTGFSFSARREDGQQMLDSLGLKKGDVLVSVNGTPASQMPSNPKLWKALLKADKIKLKVLRDGGATEISIN